VDARLEKNPGPRPTTARWLFALVAVVCVLALVEGVRLSWSQAPSETRSVSPASRPDHPPIGAVPARGGSDSDVNQSGRMPIRVSIERAHVQVKCASDSRVPIAIMEQCQRHGARTWPHSMDGPGIG
jgi:hypothetical protein